MAHTLREWLRRLRVMGRSRRFDDDLADELNFHLEMRANALEGEGVFPDEARRQARREVGRPLQIREASREVWVFRWLDQWSQDVRYALRSFQRQPGFTAAVVGTLALGIGANTAIFSIVDALLLRPAPFVDPARLLIVHAARPAQHQLRLPLSYPNFVDLRARSQAFEGLSAWTIGEATLTGRGEPEHVQWALTTANLFDVLGVGAEAGRTFAPQEDRQGTAPVVLISHALWTRRFARDPAAIGATLILDGAPHTIIGVTPDGFRFASYPHDTDVWLPFGLDKFTDRQYARGLSTLLVVGRMKPGLSVERAQLDVTAVASSLEQAYPENNRARMMFVVPLETVAVAHVRQALVALGAGVVLVLLIACANVVNLLLGRASSRQHELAVRAVLGGSRRRIGVQLLTEHVVLALAGGAGGLLVARLAQDLLSRLPYNTTDLFTPWVAPLDHAGLNPRVLLFTLVSSVAVGLFVGVLPAFQTAAAHPASLAEGGARVVGPRRATRLRSGLVIAEVAMAVVLLSAMGLMLTTVVRLSRVDPGFSPEGVTALNITIPSSRYRSGEQIARFYSEALERIRRSPGVVAAGAVEYLPFGGADSDTGLLFDGQPVPTPDKRPRAHYRAVTDGYFEAMRIPIVAGRGFTNVDQTTSPMTAVVNATAARDWFADGRSLGRKISLDFEAMKFFPDRAPIVDLSLGLREVVGLVRDVRHGGLSEEAQPEFYIPFAQRRVGKMTVVVRSTLPTASVQSMLRSVVTTLDPEQPIGTMTALTDLVASSMARPRFNTTLLVAFGALALTLAAIGIYGVMSYFVLSRSRDIGIHIALGATPAEVFRLVTNPMLLLAVAGLAIGIVGAWTTGPALSQLLFGVQPRDPAVLASVVALVLVAAAAAILGPALRAMRIDPARTLR